MSEIVIPYGVDAALERGIEGCGPSREDALRLMEEGPLEQLLEALRRVGIVLKTVRSAIPRKSLFRSPTSAAIIAAIALSGQTPNPCQPTCCPRKFSPGRSGRSAEKEALFSLGDQPERVFPEAKEFRKSWV
jgi:hypothetical protein